MKHIKNAKRIAAAFLCTVFFAVSFAALGAGIGSVVYTNSIGLSDSVTYREMTANHTQSGRQQAYMVEYKPGGSVSPVVAYGSKLYGRSDIYNIASYVSGQGKTFLAGINADYFTLATGVPNGLVVTDGVLRSSDAWQNAVGFLSDGSAVIGAPQLNMRLTSDTGLEISITYINKVRTVYGVYLLNEDFSASTHISTSGTNVLLRRLDNTPVKIGGTLRMRVESISKTSQSEQIPEGCMILTVDDKGPENRVSELAVGQELTLAVNSNDTRWNNVVYAVGAGDMLLENGQVSSDLSDKIMPCTAVGVKSDGSVLLYTIDGRQSGFSAGLTLPDLAAELKTLDCVTAVNLDGGGSTTMAVQYPGQDALTVTNSPSDGELRKCANYIVLTNNAARTGTASRLYVYPYDAFVLAGANVTLNTRAVDSGYYPSAVPGSPSYTLSSAIGTMQGSAFTAGQTSGTTQLTVSSGGLSGTANISVYSYMDELKIQKTGQKSYVSSLSLSPGDTVSLDAVPLINNRTMYSQDNLFIWSTEGNIGSIDQNGDFTASQLKGLEGSILVSYNGSSVKIPVTVGQAPSVADSFDDPTNWSAEPEDGEEASLEACKDYNRVRYGTGSLAVSYKFNAENTSGDDAAGILHLSSAPTVKLKNNPDYVNLWVYGDQSGSLLSVECADASGSVLASTVQQPVDFTGWKLLSFKLPAGAAAVRCILIEQGSGNASTGTLWFDQLTQSYAEPLADTAAPVVAIDSVSLESLQASVRDESGSAVKTADITVLVDGKPAVFQYDQSSFALTAEPGTAADGMHRVTVIAKDTVGNIARVSASFGASGTSAGGKAVFADADGHWAQQYVEFLNAQGVMTGEQKGDLLYCRPESEATRAEMAALVCRYLGIDTTQYDSVSLPYEDNAKIPSWALPYVRAMYAKGLMKGNAVGDKLYFEPNASITRMETMTILGRTLPQGYALAPLTASDSASVESWAIPHFEKLMSMGVVSGYANNTIRPNNKIVRAEIATVLYRLY